MHHIVTNFKGKKYYIASALEPQQIDTLWAIFDNFFPRVEFERVNKHFGRIELQEYHTQLQFVLDYKKHCFLSETIGG